MAILQGSFSPYTIPHQSVPLKKSFFGLVMCRKTRLPVKKAVKLQIRSSIKNLVFEDRATGIICYKDESGEIICEGLDEGPRLLHPHPPTPGSLSDADILDRLQKRWLQIMDGQNANENVLVQEHTCNGLNLLH
ncbi:hypothetical protein KSS87_014579 [Heliosperma pusillum]|nr:hypothetical protein KSS87_014579 [Heliosperma pusillum]